MTSDGVITPGSNGSPLSRAPATSSGVRPGLTPNTAPASIDRAKSCARVIVPTPTMAPSTSRSDGADGLQRDRRAQRDLEHPHTAGHQGPGQRHRVLEVVDDDDRDHRSDAHQLESVHAALSGVKTKWSWT